MEGSVYLPSLILQIVETEDQVVTFLPDFMDPLLPAPDPVALPAKEHGKISFSFLCFLHFRNIGGKGLEPHSSVIYGVTVIWIWTVLCEAQNMETDSLSLVHVIHDFTLSVPRVDTVGV